MSENRDWHVDADVLRHYRDGALTFAGMASTEAHLTACGACRSKATALLETPALARVKQALDDALDTPRVGFVERTLRAAGVGVTDARIVTASLSLQVSWLIGGIVALGFAAVAAGAGAEGRGLAAFLLLAPVLPVVGVGLAFGPHADPTYEVAIASPVSGARIVLLRAAAVLGAAVPVMLLLSLTLPAQSTLAVAWLLPALALSATTLALGTVVPLAPAAVAVTGLWLLGAGLSLAGAGARTQEALRGLAAFGPTGQLAFAALALAASAAVLTRRSCFEVVR